MNLITVSYPDNNAWPGILVYSFPKETMEKLMEYDISITDNIACITIEGNLNSLDLMFMFQSKEYKEVINQYKKILIDYTNISGVSVTAEDALAITMLGKMELDKSGKIDIAVAVNENERDVMENVTKSIFADSQSEVFILDSSKTAFRKLQVS